MNFTKTFFFIRTINEINKYETIQRLNKFNFRSVGEKSRGKYNKTFFELIKILLQIPNLTRKNYIDFVEGLGWDEIKYRISNRKLGYFQLIILLQKRCKYSDKYIEERNVLRDNG